MTGCSLFVRAASAEERKDYYDSVGVAWAARPGHGVDGYVRRGRFKKSSNLNSVKTLSLRVEEVSMSHIVLNTL